MLCYFSGNLLCILFFSIYFLVILGAILIVFGFNCDTMMILFLISLFIFGYIYFISNIYIITIVLYIYIYSARHFESVIYYIFILCQMKMLYFCHIKAIFDTTCHVSKPLWEGKLERVPFLALAMILNHF